MKQSALTEISTLLLAKTLLEVVNYSHIRKCRKCVDRKIPNDVDIRLIFASSDSIFKYMNFSYRSTDMSIFRLLVI